MSQIPRSSVPPLLEISSKLPVYRFMTLGYPYQNPSLHLVPGEAQNVLMLAKILP